MFHHFHGGPHPKGQGALSTDQFNRMLDGLSARYNLLSADVYFGKAVQATLDDADICLSFDDALLCQYDIAVPILDERRLGAFFFIYSSPLNGEPDCLEIFRWFRTVAYRSVDDFYADFFALCESELGAAFRRARNEYGRRDYLKAFPFYSGADRWFRYLRDETLGPERYRRLMLQLMDRRAFRPQEAMKHLWMTNEHIRDLHDRGHVIGLHSYSHPTALHKLSREDQEAEYRRNRDHLEGLLGEGTIAAMSHPCGNYNDDTLDILARLGIRLGFRSSMAVRHIRSPLEIPREDHANIAREMGL